VKFVAEKIAELREMSYEEVCRITAENAIKLFNIPLK
jgi:TatD DNase family protein